MKWFDIEEELPPEGAKIIAELKGCKVADYIYMEIREGEGLGHLVRWRFATEEDYNDNKWEELKKECPRLYAYPICFEVNKGWYELIRELSLKLEDLIKEFEKGPDYECDYSMYASQVKEKYGTLRFYMSTATEEIEDLIDQAEKASRTICEECGEEGELRGQGWYYVACDNCNERRGKSW